MLPEEALPEEVVPKEDVPEEEVPEVVFPEGEVPEEELPEEGVPEEGVPKEEVPEEEVPEEDLPEEGVPEEEDEPPFLESSEKEGIGLVPKIMNSESGMMAGGGRPGASGCRSAAETSPDEADRDRASETSWTLPAASLPAGIKRIRVVGGYADASSSKAVKSEADAGKFAGEATAFVPESLKLSEEGEKSAR
ncbi:MAG: hypothetical protein LBQ79_14945 [Deltaproteobacteria bacterium]|nr:hypothetical protein [Deltaproteobacteria bacterium]